MPRARTLPALAAAAALVAAPAPQASASPAELLADGSLDGWEEVVFDNVPPTGFERRHDDGLGRHVLHIRSERSSSGWNLERRITLAETPYLKIRWRIARVGERTGDPSTKQGDDYPLRVYLHKTGFMRLSLRSLQLVVSPVHDRGEHWTSPYSSGRWGIMAYAFAGAGDIRVGEWQETVLDIPRLWDTVWGEEAPPVLDGLGILSDSDGGESVSELYLDGMWLLSEPE